MTSASDAWAAAVEAMRSAALCDRCNRGAIIEECFACAEMALRAAAPHLQAAVVAELPQRFGTPLQVEVRGLHHVGRFGSRRHGSR